MGAASRVAYTIASIAIIVFNLVIVTWGTTPGYDIAVSLFLVVLTVWCWMYAMGWTKEYRQRNKRDKRTFQVWSAYYFFSVPFSGIRMWNRLENGHLSANIMAPVVLIGAGFCVVLTGVLVGRLVWMNKKSGKD